MIINERLFRWFEQGKVKDALLGKGDFFIPDHTYRSHHDSLLIINQLFQWVDSKEKKRLVNKVFYEVVDFLLEENAKEAFRLILTYCIVKNRKDVFLLDELPLIAKTKSMIDANAREITSNDQLRAIVMSIEKYLPQVSVP